MRTVTFTINISIDGYADHTIGTPSEELMGYFTRLMDDVDLIFFGRVMYELMFPYWADVARDQSGTPEENKFAERLTAIDKVVISRSLASAGYNTRIVSENPADELQKLKQQPGKKISVDTVSMLPELATAGLIDEFNLVVHPVIAGNGRRLFEQGSLPELLNLKLANAITFKSGHVALEYVKQN